MKTFAKNAFRWLAEKSDLHQISFAHRAAINPASHGFSIVQAFTNFVPSRLESVGPDIYMVDATHALSDQDTRDIVNYVERGGGLIVSFNPWVWFRNNRRQNCELTYANGQDRNKYCYNQNRIKCSRPISSLPGLQGHKIFADAIIKILIPFKSISDKICYDQLFINKVVQIFTFQFDESVTKFNVVKVLLILMKCS